MRNMFIFFRVTATAAILSLFIVILSSCTSSDYLDPTQVGRFRPVPAVNVILDSLGVADETPPTFEGCGRTQTYRYDGSGKGLHF